MVAYLVRGGYHTEVVNSTLRTCTVYHSMNSTHFFSIPLFSNVDALTPCLSFTPGAYQTVLVYTCVGGVSYLVDVYKG